MKRINRRVFTLIAVFVLQVNGAEPSPFLGDIDYAEHFAIALARHGDGLAGPAKQATLGWTPEMCTDWRGNAYFADQEDNKVFRVDTTGTMTLIAGCGIKGYLDGPADQARLDMGIGSYSDAAIMCDTVGNVFLSEGMNQRVRKIYQKEDGSWWVTTVVGYGTVRPQVGQWSVATQSFRTPNGRFAVSKDGKRIYFPAYGGLYKVLVNENKITLLAPEAGIASWGYGGHTGGDFVTSDSVFYWTLSGETIVRYDEKTGQSELFVDSGTNSSCTGYRTRVQMHTVFAAYAPEASAIFWGGADQEGLWRESNDTVKVLQSDGTWGLTPTGALGPWRAGKPFFGNFDHCVYSIPSSYAWPRWIVRYHFVGALPGTASEGFKKPALPTPFSGAPNPFTRQVSFKMEGGGLSRSLIEIFSGDGRLVKSLAADEAGVRSVVWDGKDSHGRALATGRYVARYSAANGKIFCQSLTLLR